MANSTSLLVDSEITIAEASIRTIANSEDIRLDHFERLHQLLSATRRSPLSWTMIADYEGNGLMNTLAPSGTPLARRSGNWAAKVYDSQQTRVGRYFLGTMARRDVVSVNVPSNAARFVGQYVRLVQGPTTLDRSQGGLGLGLSIAKELVQMHGGSFTAHSEGLGKGSVFTVRLPLSSLSTL